MYRLYVQRNKNKNVCKNVMTFGDSVKLSSAAVRTTFATMTWIFLTEFFANVLLCDTGSSLPLTQHLQVQSFVYRRFYLDPLCVGTLTEVECSVVGVQL